MQRNVHLSFLSICSLLILPFLLQAQQEYFLEIPNIDGEATTAGYEDQICISSFSWDVTSTITTGGGGSGRGVAGPFRMGKNFDLASPLLYLSVPQGRFFPDMTLTIVTMDGNGQRRVLGEYSFTDVRITSYEPGGNTTALPTEVITITFGELEIKYFDSRGSETSATWNFTENVGG